MRRRDFITTLGGAVAVTLPIAVRAQQPAIPVVGYLEQRSPEPTPYLLAAFRKGLSEAGYVEGRNVEIEYRWAHDDRARLAELVADLVRRRVAVIATPGSDPAALAAKAATASIPIVFSTGTDPVQTGLVSSLNRPGGNITGVTTLTVELGSKRLDLLHQMLPRAGRIALLSVDNPNTELAVAALRTGAARMGLQLQVFYASTNREIDTAFAGIAQKRADAVMVIPFIFFANSRDQLAGLAAHYRIPAMYADRLYAEAGGLMSYGASIAERERRLGIYTGRILKGEKPYDLPVMQPSKFELVINMKTAKALGLTIPETLLATADEVIQ